MNNGAQNMKLATDTTWDTNHGDENFKANGYRLAWRVDGEIRWSQLYNAAPEAKAWDGAPADSQAIGSIFGCFSYVLLKTTGRAPTWVPHTSKRVLGVKAKVTFSAGTEDENTVDAWIVKN